MKRLLFLAMVAISVIACKDSADNQDYVEDSTGVNQPYIDTSGMNNRDTTGMDTTRRDTM